ncbi:MAG: DUF1292 domain-containing protein [Clostridia bacterium]|nr:DUF1292 domain-containing protein [Clostridia bacterium]
MNEFDENAFEDDYEPELITLYDEDDNEIEMEILDIIDYEGDNYAVMIPNDEEADEVIIMQIDELNDEEDSFSPVADEDTLDTLFEIFKERNKDEFNFED